MCKKQKVREVTLTVEDLGQMEKFLHSKGFDSLDMVEILMEIERIKNITLDI